MTTGFDHIHIIGGFEESCFLLMFENEVCLEQFAEKNVRLKNEDKNKRSVFLKKFYWRSELVWLPDTVQDVQLI